MCNFTFALNSGVSTYQFTKSFLPCVFLCKMLYRLELVHCDYEKLLVNFQMLSYVCFVNYFTFDRIYCFTSELIACFFQARIFKTRIALDARIKELANFVDGFYQKLGIRVVLSHVEVWNHTDRIALSSNPTTVSVYRIIFLFNCFTSFLHSIHHCQKKVASAFRFCKQHLFGSSLHS